MKEKNTTDTTTVNDVIGKIWQSFDVLRREPISFNDTYFTLLLLTLQRNHFYGEYVDINDLRPHEIKETIEDLVYNLLKNKDHVHYDVIKGLYEFYKPQINKVSQHGIYSLVQTFKNLDQNVLNEHFAEIFDYLLSKLSSLEGKYSFAAPLPEELCRFVCQLANTPKNAKVYNPYAGVGSLSVYIDKDVHYLGQEFSMSSYAISKLRLLAYDRSDDWIMLQGEPGNNWNPSGEQFDLIISQPPFGMRMPNYRHENGENSSTVDHFLIAKGISDLTANGKLIAVFRQGFLSDSGSLKKLRQQLIEGDLIESIISIPGGLLTQTSIPICVVVINKVKKDKKIVHFIDAKKFVIGTNARDKKLDDQSLLAVVNSQVESDSNKFVPNESIENADYNLSVPVYFQEKYHGVHLGGLGKFIQGKRVNNVTGKQVKISHLKNDKFDFQLDLAGIENTLITKTVQQIDQSCLLLSVRGKLLKPTYFVYSGTPILINSDIVAFKVNETIVDIEYLINELYSSYFQDQLDTYRVGSVIPTLRKADLEGLIIILSELYNQNKFKESLDEQKAKVRGAKETYFQSKEKELELQKELIGFKEDTFREFASIKHTLRQYINALKSNVSGTRKYIAKNDGKHIRLDDIYSANLNQTFGEHLNSLEGSIDSIARLLETNNAIDSTASENIDFVTLITSAQGRFKNEDSFSFTELFVDKNTFANDGSYLSPLVGINKDDFYAMFSNIISNAVSHGFKGSIKKNVIKTELHFDEGTRMCVLKISNNGKPFDEAFTFKHLTTRGEKTSDSDGLGTGGADIKRIVEKYGGTFTLEKDKNSEFPVNYVISFPMQNSIEDAV